MPAAADHQDTRTRAHSLTGRSERLATAPAFIFAVALAARISLLIGLYTSPVPGLQRLGQTNEMAHLAHSLAAGAGLSSPFGGHTGPSAMIGPVYPWLVSLVFSIFGELSAASLWTLLTLQCVFSALICPIVQHIGTRMFRPQTGTVAAWLWAASPAAILVPAFWLWDTCLGALLFAAMLLALLRADTSSRKRDWLVAGVAAGISALVTPVTIPPAAALLAWSSIRRARRRMAIVGPLLVSVMAGALVLAPWVLRNYVVFHRPILRSNFGLELWIGNHEGSHGYTEMQMQPATDQKEFALYARMGELRYFQAKREEATRYIRMHPWRFVRLTVWRIGEFWSGFRDMWGVATFAVPFVWIGLIGLAWMWRESVPLAIAIVVFPLPYYITHPDMRFRYALEPFLMVLAAEAFLRLRERRHSREQRASATAV